MSGQRALEKLRIVRFFSQAIFLAAFLYAFLRSLDPFAALENPFLRWDPLIALTYRPLTPALAAPALLLLLLALVLGRCFCGWICPLGVLIDSLDLLLGPLRRKNPAALARVPWYPALVRYPPALALLGVLLLTLAAPLQVLQFLHPHIWSLRIASLSPLGFAFLALLAFLALFSRRLWCTTLCPLGALYGLLSRLSFFKLRLESCSACGLCDRCPTGAAVYRKKEVLAHQCILCFDYEHRCPAQGFRYSFPSGGGPAAAESRRSFFLHGAQLAGGALLGGVLGRLWSSTGTGLLRPPGVVSETRFLEQCLRCLQCVRSCPTGIIKATGLEGGWSSLFTPHLSFGPEGCEYNCQVCQQVCPNHAIPLQRLREKQLTAIGIARLSQEHCVVYRDGINCLVYEEFCPVLDKAIAFSPLRVRQGGQTLLLNQPRVIDSRCIGCGICEAKCPADPVAIRVSKTGPQRG